MRSSIRSIVVALSVSLVGVAGVGALAGCSKDRATAVADAPAPHAESDARATTGGGAAAAGDFGGKQDAKLSLSGAATNDRKIIRRAELSIEATDPEAAQRRATELAERMGGFVVTSDAHHYAGASGEDDNVTVSLVLRVPAERFGGAMDELRKI